jgi:L-alanine-DL-glutamate epimerase-like enolase superfamily enzyme
MAEVDPGFCQDDQKQNSNPLLAEDLGIPMKISHIQSRILVLPESDPFADSPENPNAARPIVILRIGTDDGVEGLGAAFYGGAMTRSLKAAVDDLGALTIGEDPLRLEGIVAKLRAAAGASGPGGMFTLVLAAIDIGLWDIRGKAMNQPLWKLLGGARQRVPAYASGSLRRNLSLDEVAIAAKRLKERGFREAKMQLALAGPTTPAKEVERAKTVREALGPDIKLMCDINQRWSPEEAIDIGRRVEDAGVGLFWLEDVTAHDDYAGIARVNAALATPICGGELVYGLVPFRQMIEARSVDYVMIDLIRVGGITQWMKVAGMAEAFNLPVVSHVIPEIHGHLVAAVPNGLTVEYMGWMLRLFDGVAALEDGELVLSDRPGLGLTFNQEAIDRFGAGS